MTMVIESIKNSPFALCRHLSESTFSHKGCFPISYPVVNLSYVHLPDLYSFSCVVNQ